MRQGIGNHLFATFPSQFAEHVDQSILSVGQHDVSAAVRHGNQLLVLVFVAGNQFSGTSDLVPGHGQQPVPNSDAGLIVTRKSYPERDIRHIR